MTMTAGLPVYGDHQSFEIANPAEEAYERRKAEALELAGMPSRREFPCKGFLLIESEDDRQVWVRCDACGRELLITRRRTVNPDRFHEPSTED